MSISNIMGKAPAQLMPYDLTIHDLVCHDITADNIVILNPIEIGTLETDLIEGLTVPTVVNLGASFIPTVDSSFILGNSTHKFAGVSSTSLTAQSGSKSIVTLASGDSIVHTGPATFAISNSTVGQAISLSSSADASIVSSLGNVVLSAPSGAVKVDMLEGASSDNMQISLQTAGTLSIGATGDLSAVQIQSNGVISSISSSGFSSLTLGNGAGNQLILDPATLSLIGSPDCNLTASNNVVVTANAGSITQQCATTLDISAPSGMTISTFGSGVFVNDAAGTILKITSDTIDCNGAGDLSIGVDNNLNLATTSGMIDIDSQGGNLTLHSSAAIVLDSTTGSVIVQPAALVVDTIFSSSTIGIAATTGLTESGSTVSITANSGTLALAATSGNVTMDAGGTAYLTSIGDYTIQNYAPSNMLLDTGGDMTLQAFVNSTVSAQTGAATVSGQTTATLISGTGTVVRAQTNNVQLNAVAGDVQFLASGTITSSAPFYSGAGSAGAPTYSFSGDSNTGIFSSAADKLGISSGGSERVYVSTSVIGPTSNNAMDLATAGLAIKDSFFVNAPTITSDVRLKKDIEDIPFGLELVESLHPVSYRFIEQDGNQTHLGLLAQEVEMSLVRMGCHKGEMSLVSYVDDHYGIKYEQLISVLVRSVQQLSSRVKELEAKL